MSFTPFSSNSYSLNANSNEGGASSVGEEHLGHSVNTTTGFTGPSRWQTEFHVNHTSTTYPLPTQMGLGHQYLPGGGYFSFSSAEEPIQQTFHSLNSNSRQLSSYQPRWHGGAGQDFFYAFQEAPLPTGDVFGAFGPSTTREYDPRRALSAVQGQHYWSANHSEPAFPPLPSTYAENASDEDKADGYTLPILPPFRYTTPTETETALSYDYSSLRLPPFSGSECTTPAASDGSSSGPSTPSSSSFVDDERSTARRSKRLSRRHNPVNNSGSSAHARAHTYPVATPPQTPQVAVEFKSASFSSINSAPSPGGSQECSSAGNLDAAAIEHHVEQAGIASQYWSREVTCRWGRCGAVLPMSELRTHLREAHKVNRSGRVSCRWSECGMRVTGGSMLKHLRSSAHLNTRLACLTCSAEYTRRDALTRHLKG